jgi:hypothetical protein
MPAEQRIVGGGLLIVGIAIVLILLYIFTWGGTSPEQGLEELRGSVYPAWLRAEERGDYAEMKRRAQEALDVVAKHGRAAITKQLQGEATGGDRDSQRLYDLVAKDGFERNAQGLYSFQDGWFRSASHQALSDLAEAVDSKARALRRIREAARDADKAMAQAREGSGHPLAYPPAKEVPEELAVVDPNPVYAADRELFRVFGITPEALAAALGVPNPGGKATSARILWNRDVVPGNLDQRVERVPEEARALPEAATAIRSACEALARDPEAAAATGKLLRRAADLLAEDLAADAKAAFEEHRAAFQDPDALARVLAHEAKMLEPYLATIRELGRTFEKEFAK